ncbi:MAG TPA: carboxypeptidase-like regulatory domain-containing protein, partial [Polyangiales bacterium]|nr:carboxypeptidase-like regulatory domain-containing protein [Polyangiales bacterium]
VRVEAPGLVAVQREFWPRGAFPSIGFRLQREAVLAGRVIDETGAPVADATLEARAESDPTSAEPLQRTSGDAQGRFALRGLPAGSYALIARAPLHELTVLPKVQAPSGGDGLQVVLVRTSALRGEVRAADGSPAVKALVTAAGSGLWPPRSLETDAQGRFELSPLPAGIYELRAKLGASVSAPAEGVVLEPAAASFVTLSLVPGADLRGRVVDAATGLPLEAQNIVVEDALSAVPARTKTDAKGEFVVAGLRPLVHRVWARAPGYVPVAGQSLEPGFKPHVLSLLRAGSVSGVIVDETGQPVAGAEIELSGTAIDGSPLRVAAATQLLAAGSRPPPAGDNLGITEGPIPKVPLIALPQGAPGALATDAVAAAAGFVSDAAGVFSIEGVAPGRFQVVARHARFAPSRSALETLAPGGSLTAVTVLMSRGIDLTGRVLDARGFPAASIRVQLLLEGEPSARATLSAADGSFAFPGVRGNAVLSAHPAGSPEVRETLALDGSGSREVLLTLGGDARALAGRVVDSRGFPIEGALVRVESKDPRSPTVLSAASGSDGTFRVDGLPAPPDRVAVERAGFAPIALAAVNPRPGEEVRVALVTSASLAGQVLDRLRSEPIAGALVRLAPRAGGSAARTATTDAQGWFEFLDVSAGDYSGSVHHDGHITAPLSARLQEGRRSELEAIALEPAGAISGDVVDRLGAPVAGALVAVGDPPSWTHGIQSDERGHFRLASVEPGQQALSARHPNAGESTRQVTVRVYPQQESPGIVLRLGN